MGGVEWSWDGVLDDLERNLDGTDGRWLGVMCDKTGRELGWF